MYQLLENPHIYNLVQNIFALGGNQQVRTFFNAWIDCSSYKSALELGCGTGQWPLSKCEYFVRTDINEKYFPAVAPPGTAFERLDAADLSPFADGTFELVYSMCLYHHLPDGAVVRSLKESARVIGDSGRIVIFDAALPTSSLNLPGMVVRKLDRGRYVRSLAHTVDLVRQASLTIPRMQSCRWCRGVLEGCFIEAVPAR